ncbi:C-type lectin domain family 4 member K-like [Sinocyclocheilus grahami]|uniref:C-type lectin domain family 4 member K-like n=1 Tax=Sinocyclocheilus grahami TaxID=75366 RepID=UPI0007AD0E01|nr:PREDICTED: C-type lectin domain family 4 member K-like [Sinocyclocheilus grahami]
MSGHVNESMDKGSIMDSEDRIEKMVDIYVSAEAVRDMKHKKDKEDFDNQTPKTQTPQHTGSDPVRNRSSRAAAVCLVLLCVLLLTAVIVLCVTFTQERQQFISKNENLTNEREQLILKNTNLTNERKQLRNQLQICGKVSIVYFLPLTQERQQLISKIENLTNEREQLILKNTNLTNEREQLILKNTNLTNERKQLRNQLQICVEWTCYRSSFYYMSKENKTWTESRRYCTEKGADLIIINNREEKDFVHNTSGNAVFYIGLTDTDVEGSWKWVDESTLNSSFWASGEPNRGQGIVDEDCVVTVAVPKLPEWPNLDFVKKMFGSTTAYIGLTDSDVEARWKWVDGTNMTSGLWGLGEPNGYITENCGLQRWGKH